MPRHLLPLLFGFFTVIGVCSLIGAAGLAWYDQQWLNEAQRTTGVVADYDWVPDQENGGGTWRPIVTATAANGMPMRIESKGSSSHPIALGTPVPVAYHADRPDQARLLNFGDRWVGPMVFGLIGVVFAGLGLVGLLFRDRLNR